MPRAGYAPGGRDKFGSTLHWGPDWSTDSWSKTHQTHSSSSDLSDDFHVYGLVWNETYIGTYLDTEDQVVLSFPIKQSFWELGGWGSTRNNPWLGRGNNAPFDSEMYLIINVAVGGTNSYFPDGYGKPWSNADPSAINAFWSAKAQWYPTWTQPMAIDYVKVWSLKNATHSDQAIFNTFLSNRATGTYSTWWLRFMITSVWASLVNNFISYCFLIGNC